MAYYKKENKPKLWMSQKEIQNSLGKVPAHGARSICSKPDFN